MNQLADFFKNYPPAPIVPPERLDMLLRIVNATIAGGAGAMKSRGDPRRHDKKKEAVRRRVKALRRAIGGLTDSDRRLLSIALSMEEDAGEEITVKDSLTTEADTLLERLDLAAKWIVEGGDRRRYDAHLRNQFVEAAARLFVAYGFETIGGNSHIAIEKADVFQQFVNALLMDYGLPESGGMRPSPFNVQEFSVDPIGKTEEDRAAWVKTAKKCFAKFEA